MNCFLSMSEFIKSANQVIRRSNFTDSLTADNRNRLRIFPKFSLCSDLRCSIVSDASALFMQTHPCRVDYSVVRCPPVTSVVDVHAGGQAEGLCAKGQAEGPSAGGNRGLSEKAKDENGTLKTAG